MSENIIIKTPGFGTIEEKDNSNDPNAGPIITGAAATPEAARIIRASIQKGAEVYITKRPYSIPPLQPENKTIYGWFAYYDDCIKCGEPKTHETVWQMYNEQCKESRTIPTVEAWRKKYSRWKQKRLKKE
jgi:hypothetical protein